MSELEQNTGQENEQQEIQPKETWLQKLGALLTWAGGIGASTIVITALIMAIIALFSASKFANFFRPLSDGMFWAFAVLLFLGIVMPNEEDVTPNRNEARRKTSTTTRRATTKKPTESDQAPLNKWQEQRRQKMNRRMARVYNPWRWRVWFASLIVLLASVLFGMLSGDMVK